jgi:hypothetical protein
MSAALHKTETIDRWRPVSVLPDGKPLEQTADFKALNLSAKYHLGQQRQIRQGNKKERCSS